MLLVLSPGEGLPEVEVLVVSEEEVDLLVVSSGEGIVDAVVGNPGPELILEPLDELQVVLVLGLRKLLGLSYGRFTSNALEMPSWANEVSRILKLKRKSTSR